MYIRDLQITKPFNLAKPERFGWQTNCVVDHFLSCMPRTQGGDIAKVVIKAIPMGEAANPIKQLMNVLMVFEHFDYAGYAGSENYERKEMLLELLTRGLLNAANDRGWSKEPFLTAKKCVINENFLFARYWKKDKWDKKRRTVARVLSVHDMDSLDVYMVLSNKKGEEIGRKYLLRTENPDRDYLRACLGNIVWDGDSVVTLVSKDRKSSWVSDFASEVAVSAVG